jgi:NADH oxidase (H2O2-forming)
LNKDKNIVIIGCGAGGGTSAQFARKTDRKAKIVVFEKSSYTQYSKCGLPYVISGDIPKFNDLIEFSRDWFNKNNIDVLNETTVENIDVKNKIVLARQGDNIIKKPYSSLIISTGSKPLIPAIQNLKNGENLIDGIYTLNTIEDAKKISKYIKKCKKATIIGAGLIGLEMADCLYQKGIDITVVESLLNILPNTLDEDMAHFVSEELCKNILLYKGYQAKKIISKNKRIKKILIVNKENSVEKIIDTDILIIAIGSKPEIKLAKNAGCKIGSNSGILVNNKSETSIEDVYAVGDCTEYLDFVTKEHISLVEQRYSLSQ